MFFMCFGIQVIYFTGDVALYRNGVRKDLVPLMTLIKNDRIETGPLSGVLIRMDDGSTIKIGENSKFTIKDVKTKPPKREAHFKLGIGTALAKVVKRKYSKFSIETPTGVVGVRGTEFAVTTDGQNTEVYVFEGSVHFETQQGASYIINPGQYASNTSPPKEIPPEKKQQLSQQLGEEVGKAEKSEEEKKEEIKRAMKRELRESMREAINDARRSIEDARNAAGEIRSNELSASRVLKDVHGNVVRVEQRLLRPATDTVVLINVTRRDNYNYRGLLYYIKGFDFSTQGPRTDTARTEYVGNMDIPMNISEWPAFLANNMDTFKFERITSSITNSFGEGAVWEGIRTGEETSSVDWYDSYGNPHYYDEPEGAPDSGMSWDFYLVKDGKKYYILEDNEPVGQIEDDCPVFLNPEILQFEEPSDYPPAAAQFVQDFLDKFDNLPDKFKAPDALWFCERIPVMARTEDGEYINLIMYRESYTINPEGKVHTGASLADIMGGGPSDEDSEPPDPAEVISAINQVFSDVAFEDILAVPGLFSTTLDVVTIPDIYIKVLQEMIQGMTPETMDDLGGMDIE